MPLPMEPCAVVFGGMMNVFRQRMLRRRRRPVTIGDYAAMNDTERQDFNANECSMFAAHIEFLAVAVGRDDMPLVEWPRSDFIGIA